jgi:5'-deoxynucleotidase YfbR-like HD superfamily hydrolase
MKEYYDKLIRLSYICRYSNIPRIKNESVAEHSFLVAALVIKLYEEYKFNLGVALLAAVSHDITEYIVNDVTHETKKLFPEIAKYMRKAEGIAADSLPEHARLGIKIFNGDIQMYYTESLVVQLADIIQCQQYAENEVRLGNSGYMACVVRESIARQEILKNNLSNFKRDR